MILNTDDDDPDGSDTWDEELWDNPHRVELTLSGPEEEQQCRHYAELAHYFNDLATPIAVNRIAGPTNRVPNHELTDLSDVMQALHDYFVSNKKYYLVYQQVWQPMADSVEMLRPSEQP